MISSTASFIENYQRAQPTTTTFALCCLATTSAFQLSYEKLQCVPTYLPLL